MAIGSNPAQGTPPAARSITTSLGSGVFARQSSGLVRELGVVAAVGISLAAVAVSNTFINFDGGLTDFARADMYLPLLAGAVIWVVAMFAYRNLLNAIPRAGGEYVFLSRIVSPVAGSIAGLVTALIFMYVLSSNAHFAAQFVPFMLTAMGQAFHSTAIANAGQHVTGTGALVLMSVGVMVIVALSSIFSARRVAQVIVALIVVQLVAFLALIVVLLSSSHSEFVSAFARYSGHPTAYQSILHAASAHGIPFGISIGAGIAIIPFMVLNYNGVLYSYYVGGELRRPSRTYLYASAISVAVLVVLWVVVWALLRAKVGLDFMQAQANLGAKYATTYGKITSLNATAGGLGYGLVLSHNPVADLLFGVAVPFAEIAVNLAFVLVTTRVLFAQAFDRLLPVRLASVNEKTHAPMVAVGLVVAVGIVFCVLTGYVTLGSIVAQESLFFALILLGGGVAALFLPLRRGDLLSMPGLAPEARRRRLRLMVWAGALTTALALFTVIEVLKYSNVYGKFSVPSVVTLVLVLGGGPAIYGGVRYWRRKKNAIDLNLAMHELPPD